MLTVEESGTILLADVTGHDEDHDEAEGGQDQAQHNQSLLQPRPAMPVRRSAEKIIILLFECLSLVQKMNLIFKSLINEYFNINSPSNNSKNNN